MSGKVQREPIEPGALRITICRAWNDDWFLLTSGKLPDGSYNTMTVAWGSIGVMWSRPFAMAVVRPTRYTYEFMERNPDFTLSMLGQEYHDALMLCGTRSGREMDKVAESGLTPVAGRRVGSPAFDEALLIVECRTIYRDWIRPEGFMDPSLDDNYSAGDYHRVYYGEIVHVEGTGAFQEGGLSEERGPR